MRKKEIFTKCEVEQLKKCKTNGGIFLRLSENLKDLVEVIATDDTVTTPVEFLNYSISSKIYSLYKNKELYNVQMKDGHCTISLSWFIVAFC